jgi:hypothetical protein
MRGTEQGGFMSEEREKRSSEEPDDVEAHKLNQRMGEPEDKFARMGEPEDVEAHKLNQRMGETEEQDKFAATDEDDVEAHVLSPKLNPGKMQS